MYRSSRQSYQRQQEQGMFQSQQWSEIIAHYEIQVQIEHKKLRQMQQNHKHKIQQLQKRIRQQAIQRQLANNNIATSNQPLQLQIQSRRRQIQLLIMKLQQLRKSPHLKKYTTIDQLLIPSPLPQIEIQQKQKQIRQLQNQLIQAENIFEGKYVIEHKLINEYEMELKMNKKLALELDQRKKCMDDYRIGQKRNRRGYEVNQYKRMVDKLNKEMNQLKQKIVQVEGQNHKYSGKRESYNSNNNHQEAQQFQPDKLLNTNNTSQPQQGYHNMRHKIFLSQQQHQPYYNSSNNIINPQYNIKLQSLQIQNLQSKLQTILQANQQLLKLKEQKLVQLGKIKQLNQITENQKNQIVRVGLNNNREASRVMQSQSMIKERYFQSRDNQKRVSWEQSSQKEKKQIEQMNHQQQQQQPQGLLESVIKFFRNFNNQQKKTQNLQQIQRERGQSQNLYHSIPKPITGRDTLASSALINRWSPLPNQYMQRQQQQLSYRNSTPQQNKYNMFGLEQVYKKNTPKTESQ